MADKPASFAPPRSGQKTYWHLLAARRVPSDYEVVTTQLHYYPVAGFAVATPVADWYRRHQTSPPGGDAPGGFADPRETTYTSYVQRKHEQEIHLDRACAGAPVVTALAPPAVALWESVIAPCRYPLHGLQMLAAYAASMAPWSRLTVTLAFQASDELQRIHRLAYRLAQLRATHPALGEDSRARWEQAPAWQGIRECVERLLVTYDWLEAYVAVNVVFKPLWEQLILHHCAARARRLEEPALAAILDCYADDGRWHHQCTMAACRSLEAAQPELASALERIAARWQPSVQAACESLARALDAISPGPESALDRLKPALARPLIDWRDRAASA